MKPAYWILIVLILIGGFYRVYDLGHDSYWIDESYTVLAAKNIGKYGVPKFDSGINNGVYPLEYSLFVLGSIFGYDHVPMRILSAIAGTLLIYFVFLLVRKYHDVESALIASGLITFSYFMIAWSRQARMYIFVAMFAVLAVYYYLSFIQKHNRKDALLTLLFLCLGYFLHSAILMVFVAMLLHYVLLRRMQLLIDLKRLHSKHAFIMILSSVIFIGLLVYVFIGFSPLFTFEKNYFSSYQNFLLNSQYAILFFAVMGLFGVKKDFWKNSFYFIVILVSFLTASLLVPYLNYRYLFVALPFLFVLAAQGIMYLFRMYTNRIYRVAVIVMIAAIFIFSNYIFLPKSSYTLEVGTPQPPFKDAYVFAGNVLGDSTLIVTQPAVSELYLRKADYWLAISYENRELTLSTLYNSTTGVERYTGIQTIDSVEKLDAVDDYIIVIDDMGLQRLSEEKREIVLNLDLLETFGDTYWNTVYVYRKI